MRAIDMIKNSKTNQQYDLRHKNDQHRHNNCATCRRRIDNAHGSIICKSLAVDGAAIYNTCAALTSMPQRRKEEMISKIR
jgi:hypothetical protein